MRPLPALAVLLVTAAPLAAQRPADWRYRFDRPNVVDSTLVFQTMSPGWHITTGPAAILYKQGQTATGRFRAEMEVNLFTPSDHPEGYGMFIGGRDLEAAGQTYTYFLLRKDGQFLIKQRNGAQTRDIMPWTANPAVVAHPGGSGDVKNTLAVEVGADSVTFLVNARRVHAMPRSALNTDGQVGLRINHGLNVHVSKLTVTATAAGR